MSKTHTDSVMDPHGKKRAKSVSEAAKGEVEARPDERTNTIVSKPPPPPASVDIPTSEKDGGKERNEKAGGDENALIFTDQLRNCCIRYYEFYRIEEKERREMRESARSLERLINRYY